MVNKSPAGLPMEDAGSPHDLVVDDVVPPIPASHERDDTWPVAGADWAPQTDDAMEFSLTDMVPDEHGEVVLFNDTDAVIRISTDLPIIESGIAETHVTATGIDVTGMMYSVFEGGLTLYHDTQLDLSLA